VRESGGRQFVRVSVCDAYKYSKNQKIIDPMGLFDLLKRIFRRGKTIESIQSPIQSIESLSVNDSIASIASRETREIPKKEALMITGKGSTETQRTLTHPTEPTSESGSEPEQATIEKDSYQLGLAAGYTGKSIKEIEHSLSRIEAQIVTKEWFKSEFKDQTPELAEILENIKEELSKHDLNTQKRFESIQSSLERLQGAAVKAPEPLREDILKEIEAMKSQIPLSGRMKELVLVVKSLGEISYENLATRLGITTPALRGLLSNTMNRTTEIERFRRAGKGWVRYKSGSGQS